MIDVRFGIGYNQYRRSSVSKKIGSVFMFDQSVFGKRLRMFRTKMKLTQKETALKIGVSEQAISKWENGICLPDVYNLKLLASVLKTSVDDLLDVENGQTEKLVDMIKIGDAVFEIVEKTRMILAGKIIYAKEHADMDSFDRAIGAVSEEDKQAVYERLTDTVLPVCDITLSVNFWLEESSRAYGFVREVQSEDQPEGIDVYIVPPSLYIRAYTDKSTAQLMAKEQCEIWELFAYIRNYFMPANGYKMAENGAQELEVFDTSEHTTGYAYMPVERI